MAKPGKKKYYVVWEGVTPGIYRSWAETQAQVKGYPGARYQAFRTEEEAREAFHGGAPVHSTLPKGKAKPKAPPQDAPIVWKSICVDAACSGNPGKMEYRGVDTITADPLFHLTFPLGTNNIGEFLAIVHGLAMLQKQDSQMPIYSDSRNAIKWVQNGKCKTTLVRNAKTASLYTVIARAEAWLAKNTFPNPLLKWKTDDWGEIPADFGRK